MIKDLPVLDKPREKAINYGLSNLSDAELIAILLRTGTKNSSALDIAYKIINEYKTINNLSELSIERLSNIKGVGSTKAITLLSALELGKRLLKAENNHFKAINSKIIYENTKFYFFKQKQELLYILFLNKSRNVIRIKRIYKGTNDLINIAPNEIFKEAYLHSSSNIIIIHNHPSGNLYPSKNDIDSTSKLMEAGKILNVNILDHLIITDKGYYSFYDNGDI